MERTVNPTNGRRIKVGGPVYLQLVKSGQIIPTSTVGLANDNIASKSTNDDEERNESVTDATRSTIKGFTKTSVTKAINIGDGKPSYRQLLEEKRVGGKKLGKNKKEEKEEKEEIVMKPGEINYSQLIKEENRSLHRQIAPYVASLPDLRPASPTKNMKGSAATDSVNLRWMWVYDELAALSRPGAEAEEEVKIMNVINENKGSATLKLLEEIGIDLRPLYRFFSTYPALMTILVQTNTAALRLAVAAGASKIIKDEIDRCLKKESVEDVVAPLIRYLRDMETAKQLWRIFPVRLEAIDDLWAEWVDIITEDYDTKNIVHKSVRQVAQGNRVNTKVFPAAVYFPENYGYGYWALLEDYGGEIDLSLPPPTTSRIKNGETEDRVLIPRDVFVNWEVTNLYKSIIPAILEARIVNPGERHNLLLNNLLSHEMSRKNRDIYDLKYHVRAIEAILTFKDSRIDPGDRSNLFVYKSMRPEMSHYTDLYKQFFADPRVKIRPDDIYMLQKAIKAPLHVLDFVLKDGRLDPSIDPYSLYATAIESSSPDEKIRLLIKDGRADPTVPGVLELFLNSDILVEMLEHPRIKSVSLHINIEQLTNADAIKKLIDLPNLSEETLQKLFVHYSQSQKVLITEYLKLLTHPGIHPERDRSIIFSEGVGMKERYYYQHYYYNDSNYTNPLNLLLADGRANPAERNEEITALILISRDKHILQSYLNDGRWNPTVENNRLIRELIMAYHISKNGYHTISEVIETLLLDQRVVVLLRESQEEILRQINDDIDLLSLFLKYEIVSPQAISYDSLKQLYTQGVINDLSVLERSTSKAINYDELLLETLIPTTQLVAKASSRTVERYLYKSAQSSIEDRLRAFSIAMKDPRLDLGKDQNNLIFYLAEEGDWLLVQLLLTSPTVDPSDRNNLLVELLPSIRNYDEGDETLLQSIVNDPRLKNRLTEDERIILKNKGYND